jgi:chemotaxis signal transduction protein
VPAAVAPVACWNLTGAYGDRSCPELARVIHCRNCDVYSKAGVQLLDRTLPADYREERSRYLARRRKARELSSVSAILFRIGSHWMALPTRCFQEVAEKRTVHSLPHQVLPVLGLANVRGELITCVSLAHLLGLFQPPRQLRPSMYHRLLVFDWNGLRVCFPTHEVQGPQRLYPEDLKPAPVRLGKPGTALAKHVLHCEQGVVGLLDPNLLCSALEQKMS